MIAALLHGGDNVVTSSIIFIVAAVVVWRAGTRLAGYANRFARATGLSGALTGLLLLGGITSLPEIATSATAALDGSGDLAANNLIGGVALQVVMLALVDVLVGRAALTAMVPRPDVLAYAAMNIVLLVLVAGIVAGGDFEVMNTGVGVGAVLVLAAYAVCLRSAAGIGRAQSWRPVNNPRGGDNEEASPSHDKESVVRLTALMAGVGVVILVGGYLLTRSGEAIAERSGLGQSFFGAVFLGGATSLPELSSAIAAVRLNRPQMAIGDVLGGNLFNLSLLFLVDLLYRRGPVLAEAGAFTILTACLGAMLCAILIVGLVERRDRTILRMGYDSAAILAIYLLSLPILYLLREGR